MVKEQGFHFIFSGPVPEFVRGLPWNLSCSGTFNLITTSPYHLIIKKVDRKIDLIAMENSYLNRTSYKEKHLYNNSQNNLYTISRNLGPKITFWLNIFNIEVNFKKIIKNPLSISVEFFCRI